MPCKYLKKLILLLENLPFSFCNGLPVLHGLKFDPEFDYLTQNQTITWLKTDRDPNERCGRRLDEMEVFRFDLMHLLVADPPTRRGFLDGPAAAPTGDRDQETSAGDQETVTQ